MAEKQQSLLIEILTAPEGSITAEDIQDAEESVELQYIATKIALRQHLRLIDKEINKLRGGAKTASGIDVGAIVELRVARIQSELKMKELEDDKVELLGS